MAGVAITRTDMSAADLRDRIAAEFDVTFHERSVGKLLQLLRRLDFRHLSVRPQHPQLSRAAFARLEPGGNVTLQPEM